MFKSDDVSITVHGYYVPQFIQLYDNTVQKYKMWTCPYVGIYEEKGDILLKEKFLFDLSTSVYIFVLISINDMTIIKYWTFLRKIFIRQNKIYLNTVVLEMRVCISNNNWIFSVNIPKYESY